MRQTWCDCECGHINKGVAIHVSERSYSRHSGGKSKTAVELYAAELVCS